MTDAIQPAPFSFPDSALMDLRERLLHTRWPEPETVGDWSQGAPLAAMRRLSEYWGSSYDWRRCERQLNALNPSLTHIDGLDVHFLHIRSPEKDALPLVITHGWPGSVLEFMKVAPMLSDPRSHGGNPADAFHLVLPSLPGFGLSGKPAETGWNPERIARAWIVLMERLGYERFVAQGGDWGAAVTNMLGRYGAPAVRAIHLNMFRIFGTESAEDEQEVRALERLKDFQEKEAGYALEQGTSPQTIGYALNDSPVGQAAWHYEKYRLWTDNKGEPEHALTIDEMLDNITLYWLTGTAASSARIYWESFTSFKEQKVDLPVGVSVFPRDIYLASKRWVEQRHPNLVHFRALDKGGHFAAWEQPELFVEEVRETFRHCR